MDTPVIGREQEIAVLTRFLEAVGELPRALLIEGQPGIGKTSLLRAAADVAGAGGYRVLSCRPAESETTLAFSALRDLLGTSFGEVADELPDLQRRALAVTMLLEEPSETPPDRGVIGVGFLEMLRALARTSSVLVAIDDVQWIDGSSASVLAYATRRLTDLPVGVLLTHRSPGKAIPPALDRALGEVGLTRVALGPLSLGALHAILRNRSRTSVPRPLLRRVYEASAGNPFFALEIARALEGRETRAAGDALPVPGDLRQLLGARLDSLPSETRAALLVAAASSHPTLELLTRAVGHVPQAEDALAGAIGAGVVDMEGERIRFAHPLLASTIYSAASARQRMDVHRALASIVKDPEERARHLALATTEPDPAVAEALDEGARLARARAAPDAAAELAELARRLTPPDDADALQRRGLEAAIYHFDAGDGIRARDLLRGLADSSPPGRGRADILWRLADLSWNDIHAVKEYLYRGLDDASGSPAAECAARWALAWAFLYGGDLADAEREARASLELAEHVGDPALLAEALAAVGTCEFLRGRDGSQLFGRVTHLQGSDSTAPGYGPPLVSLGIWHMWAGELDDARATIQGQIDRYVAEGRHTLLHELHAYMGEIECRAGRYEIAAPHAASAIEIRLDAGWEHPGGTMLYAQTLLEAHRGEVATATAHALESIAMCESVGNMLWANCHRSVLGFLELSRGEYAAAHSHLEPVVRFLERMGIREHGVIPAVTDEIEALVGLGELDGADELLGWFDERFCATSRPWALAGAARCRGLLAGALGDHPGAEASFQSALEELTRVGQPLELGRTLLAQGAVALRAKRKRAGREATGQALRVFEELGAGAWAMRARDQLSRIGGRAPSRGGLTPTERRIAELVAEGGSNKEVAAALFVSVRTVEANLSHIYAKLGVRSRTALASRLHEAAFAADDTRQAGGPSMP